MSDLIEALTIFLKYGDPRWPTGCEHDTLYVYISRDGISDEDIAKLAEAGFDWDEDVDAFRSFRYGSA